MAQIITAPSIELPRFKSVFLAGGITNCKEWQKAVIEELKFEDISLFNPRQEHFDVSDKNASYKQILWEFERLERMDIFSMYYCNDNSDQPICMYELGRNIVRMQNRFPSDWEKRIVISVEDGYKRKADVLIQTELATQNKVFVEVDATPDLHSHYIKRAIRRIELSENTTKFDMLINQMKNLDVIEDASAMKDYGYRVDIPFSIEELEDAKALMDTDFFKKTYDEMRAQGLRDVREIKKIKLP